MNLPISARLLRGARTTRGLTQRQVAERAGMPASTVARIETGRIIPRTDTLDRVLRAAGSTLVTETLLGEGVDRTLIRRCLAMTPAERMRQNTVAARNLWRFRRARRVG